MRVKDGQPPWTPQIKICGVTNIADAEAAAAAGADLLGIIFAPTSPRCVTVETGREIVAAVRGRCLTVAVFQDASVETVNAVATALGCDLVQLHGRETPVMAARLMRPVIRAVTVTAETDEAEVTAWATADNVAHLLFDRPKDGKDGCWAASLERLWAAAQATPAGRRSFLAGGLSSDNVGEVVRRWQPFGVDVASGVETAPGWKDTEKMRAFCRAVRASGPGGAAVCPTRHTLRK
ncbi:MAG: phosphoribosylanthranilate isomerase [Chloracidobacterium sp.]|nr:phosphoribosylanthranilate isomerase [Chloracidobacterium sp.]MDW8218038.1 phosphoribosylanthranilate isomerase [Acidobacteriota bacterium]